VSTWGSLVAVRQFKEMGAPVSCTVLPQHFSFSEEDMPEFDPAFKASPPLRTPDDVALIQQAIGEGVIDVIASGHCPYAPYEVDVPFAEAPFGFPGLETTLAATLTHLTQKGILSPLETIRRLSTSPAELLRLEAGTLKPEGTPLAQVVVIDPNLEWTFDASRSFSRGKSTPFHGASFSGKAVLTFVGAEIYRDPALPASRYAGS
jgi:dihydroorotase